MLGEWYFAPCCAPFQIGTRRLHSGDSAAPTGPAMHKAAHHLAIIGEHHQHRLTSFNLPTLQKARRTGPVNPSARPEAKC